VSRVAAGLRDPNTRPSVVLAGALAFAMLSMMLSAAVSLRQQTVAHALELHGP
jgi:hypothetical protein